MTAAKLAKLIAAHPAFNERLKIGRMSAAAHLAMLIRSAGKGKPRKV
jgi:hypothetical protein